MKIKKRIKKGKKRERKDQIISFSKSQTLIKNTEKYKMYRMLQLSIVP
jgi:hypothetical protein